MLKGYYICDTQEKIRLPKWHRTLKNAVDTCRRLNEKNDSECGRVMARYFCGDWEDVSASMNMISGAGGWPVCRSLETKNGS